ncbi:MAG: hypothetical protein KatS3mg087_2199 [Patescibacteria group bacterium]|nr:MAG: hypothetical protein KatS3mg087_2199 [Patescibacteria group bacterium]
MILGEYNNGNGRVRIYDDGTKVIGYVGDRYRPEFPDSIDVKITDYCDMGCPYCHESSTRRGKHASWATLSWFIGQVSPYTEIAIGGGDPMSHPHLDRFLSECSKNRIICNITVNQGHLGRYLERLLMYSGEGKIRGIGVSIVNRNYKHLKALLESGAHVVPHVIAGVTDIEQAKEVAEMCGKLLILGYKRHGRGVEYFSDEVMDRITQYRDFMSINASIAFDTLAFEQLRLAQVLPKEYIELHYLGGEGEVSLYVDCVTKTIAVSSYSDERMPLMPIKEYFRLIKLDAYHTNRQLI